MAGREIESQLKHVVKALERSAVANEKILALAEREVMEMAEPSPPVCPHCGRLDPEVSQLETGGSGRLSDFVMVAEAHCCDNTIYVAPASLMTFPNIDTLKAAFSDNGGAG